MKRFKLSTVNSKYWIWVRVFDDLKSMLDYAKKTNPEDLAGSVGYFHPYWREILKGKKWIDNPNTGELVINKKHLGNVVISHELVHVAIWLWRRKYKTLKLGDHVDEKEEEFCYLYGDLFAEFISKMYKHNLY
jgi:hypothetical protein